MIQKKICMLGSFSVGKTSLVRRFVESVFSDKYLTTVGVKIDKKVLQVGGQDMTLMLWDIYGEDEFQKLRMSYLRGASGFLFVADGTRRATLDKALAIREEAVKAFGPAKFVLVLNKTDLVEQWEIEPEKEEELRGRGWSVIRSSARTGEGVELAFSGLAKAMLEA
ncbi:MAG: Rab family GTPase [Candidatus Acidiferrales bacterium]